MMKPYIIISGLDLNDPNRGTAALGYGSFTFLKENNLLNEPVKVVDIHFFVNVFNRENWGVVKKKKLIQGIDVEFIRVNAFAPLYKLLSKNRKYPFWTRISRFMKKVQYVAAINGGDGYSDIYSTRTFLNRLTEINLARYYNIPYIFLPQTLGPFSEEENRLLANSILNNAQKIYVRDECYVKELSSMGLNYELVKDLSYYMKPEDSGIKIRKNSVGINISGLAYDNSFRTLTGQFDNYKFLIDLLIKRFLNNNIPVYLIPHSYNYTNPEVSNDDMTACKDAYRKYSSNPLISFVSQNLTAPEVKFVISKMSFFIGTRMHSNFAAIYTGVPLYGLAYSSKFEGAFKSNGVYEDNISMINKISRQDCYAIVDKIYQYYLTKKQEL